MPSTILITGANRGLGLALVRQFLEEGYSVFALYRTNSQELERLKVGDPQQLRTFQVDVRNRDRLLELGKEFSDQGWEIDILVNNAAVHLEIPPRDLEELDFEDLLTIYEVNSLAPLKVVQAFLPVTKRMIVNISSEAGSIANCSRKSEFGYCMSKAALNMASKILQNRLAEKGLKVLALHPQWFRSDMGSAAAPLSPTEAAAHVRKAILQDWTISDPIYVDSVTARRMEW